VSSAPSTSRGATAAPTRTEAGSTTGDYVSDTFHRIARRDGAAAEPASRRAPHHGQSRPPGRRADESRSGAARRQLDRHSRRHVHERPSRGRPGRGRSGRRHRAPATVRDAEEPVPVPSGEEEAAPFTERSTWEPAQAVAPVDASSNQTVLPRSCPSTPPTCRRPGHEQQAASSGLMERLLAVRLGWQRVGVGHLAVQGVSVPGQVQNDGGPGGGRRALGRGLVGRPGIPTGEPSMDSRPSGTVMLTDSSGTRASCATVRRWSVTGSCRACQSSPSARGSMVVASYPPTCLIQPHESEPLLGLRSHD
jgi:hypothetical protein